MNQEELQQAFPGAKITVLTIAPDQAMAVELKRIGIQINREAKAESMRSLSQDNSPQTSANWWICSDGEDTIVGGTLDEVLKYSGIHQNQFEKVKKLCLSHAHVWFFPGQNKTRVETDPVKAHRISDRAPCNFLVVAHDPKCAQLYKR